MFERSKKQERTNHILMPESPVVRRAWYQKALFVPTVGIELEDLHTYKHSFLYQYRVLWAKTFISASDYTPPAGDNSAGLLYGKPIPSKYLIPESERTESTIGEDDELDTACDNPYSIKGQFKSFFRFPYNEENGISGVRFAGFVFKQFVLQGWFLNTLKLFTEIIPGTAVAGSNTLIYKAKDNYRSTNHTAKKIGWYGLLTLGRALFGLSSLAYFTGRAVTSPMENLKDAWGAFATMRAKNAWYWKALGVGLGLLACLASIVTTAAAYTFLAPIAVAVGTFVLGAVGLGATGIAIGLAAVEAAKFLGPVVSSIASVIGPSITHLFGLACGLLTPTVIAPVAHALEVIGSKLLNTVANLGKRFVQWCKKDNKDNSENPISIIHKGEQVNPQNRGQQGLSQNAQTFAQLHANPVAQQPVKKQKAHKPAPQVNESPKRKALQNNESPKNKKDRGCNFLGCFASLFKRSEKPKKSEKREFIPAPNPDEGPVYTGL